MKVILHGNLHGGRYVLEIIRCVVLVVHVHHDLCGGEGGSSTYLFTCNY